MFHLSFLEPVPDDVLWAIPDAAIRGPSGGNTQRRGRVVVTGQEVRPAG